MGGKEVQKASMNRFDYIVAGAGAAGLSLIVHMIESGAFSNKKILLIERHPKTKNDRTWCFWEEQPGLFEPLVYKKWNRMWFHGANGLSKLHSTAPYEYKMIRSIDFYNFSFDLIKRQNNISIKYGAIEHIHSDKKETYVVVDGERHYASLVFNSLTSNDIPNGRNYFLWQHFKGWFIKTKKEVFDPGEATLMDFRVDQHNETRFVYIMPFSKNEALVEFTVFSANMLTDAEYNDELNIYCSSILNLAATDFSVVNEESGRIAMTNHKFPSSHHNIIYIGSAGGQTKASSGYTFRFIQKHSERIVQELIQETAPHSDGAIKRFDFYDSVLLKILTEKKLPGVVIFTRMFGNNEMYEVFKFLDNESSVTDDIKLISTLPKSKFITAALSHLFQ